MADHKAPTIAEAAAKARARRKAKDKSGKSAAKAPAAASSGLIDTIRKAFSSEENVSRIESALDAVEQGVKDADADADAKRKK